jgi:lipopolysaccharide exporter
VPALGMRTSDANRMMTVTLGPAVIPLRSRLGAALFAAGGAETCNRVLSVVLSIVIARFLEPYEIGVLGLAVIIANTISILGSYSETAGITSQRHGTDAQYAVTAAVLRGVLTLIALAIIAISIPWLSEALLRKSTASDLPGLVQIASAQLVFEVLGTAPRVMLQRRLQLTRVSLAGLTQTAVFVAASVVVLAAGYRTTAIMWCQCFATACSTAMLWTLVASCASWRQPWGASVLWKEMGRSSGKVFVGTFVGYVNGRIDNVLVATVLGPAGMSFYGMAWNAARLPVAILNQALAFVLVPTVVMLESESHRLARILRTAFRGAYLVIAPVSATLFVMAPWIVMTVLGPKWLPAVICLKVMAVTILFAPLLAVAHAVLVGTGRAHLIGIASVVQLVAIAVIMVPLAARWGLLGAAVADVISTMILTAALVTTSRRAVPDLRWGSLAAGVTPIAVSIVGAAVATAVGLQWEMGLWRVAAQVVLIALVYVMGLVVCQGPGPLMEVLVICRDCFGGGRRTPPRVGQPL